MTALALPAQSELRRLFIYDPETGILIWRQRRREDFLTDQNWRRWNTMFAGKPSGSTRVTKVNGDRRLLIRVDGHNFSAGRIIWKLHTGTDPIAEIDHADGNAENNRWENLRQATHSQNMRNRGKFRISTSGAKGVSKNDNGWKAEIASDHGRIYLGTFRTKEAAASAYRQKAQELHGVFMRFESHEVRS